MFEAGAEAACVDGIENKTGLRLMGQIGTFIPSHFEFSPLHPTSCVAITLLHLGWLLGLWPNFSQSEVDAWYGPLCWGVPSASFRGSGGTVMMPWFNGSLHS